MFGALESGMLGKEFVAYECTSRTKNITCIAASRISSEVKPKKRHPRGIMLCNIACEPPPIISREHPQTLSDVCPKIDNEQIE